MKNFQYLLAAWIAVWVVFFFYQDRKSTRLNSSHDQISYAVFCLKKKKHHDADQLGAPHVDGAAVDDKGQLAVIGHGDPAGTYSRLDLHRLGGIVDRVTAVAGIVP